MGIRGEGRGLEGRGGIRGKGRGLEGRGGDKRGGFLLFNIYYLLSLHPILNP